MTQNKPYVIFLYVVFDLLFHGRQDAAKGTNYYKSRYPFFDAEQVTQDI